MTDRADVGDPLPDIALETPDGGSVHVRWWGDEVGKNNANCKDCGTEWSAKGSAPAPGSSSG